MDNQALKPNNLFNEFSSLPKEEPKKEHSEEDKALAYIGGFKGWKFLKEYADRLCIELDSLVQKAIENGADSKEVGERTIAKEIAKVYVRRFISKVEDARNATGTTD